MLLAVVQTYLRPVFMFNKEMIFCNSLFIFLLICNLAIVFFLESYLRGYFLSGEYFWLNIPPFSNLMKYSEFPYSSVASTVFSWFLSFLFSIFCFVAFKVKKNDLYEKKSNLIKLSIVFLLGNLMLIYGFFHPSAIEQEVSKAGSLFRIMASSELWFSFIITLYFSYFYFLVLNQVLFRFKAVTNFNEDNYGK